MTAEEAAFLELVCASPEDDVPRLVFADWLDERDDPRGEFIRIQCALARLSPADPNRPTLLDREAMLIARFHAPWSEPLKGIAGWTEFRRGFVETVNIETRKFLSRGKDLFNLAPVRHVRFLDVGSNLPRLTASPLLNRLSAITMYAQHLGDELAHSLVDSPHLGDLRQLNIGRNRIRDRGVQRLARSPRFEQIVGMDLSDNTIRDPGIRAVAESSNLTNLVSLELRRNEITPVGLGMLCSSATLSSLRELGAGLNYISTPYEGNIPAAGAVELRSLDLSENGLTVESLREMIRLPGFMHLEQLDLGHNEVGNAGATLLADWSGAASLRILRLTHNRIGDDGARALARSNYLFNLTDLDVSDNPMHDPGAFEFLNSLGLPRMKNLAMPHLGLTPRMKRALAGRYNS
ncbi:TIGR02996 domain-containing protein [Zavarzinella formosa]|uniref:TIGR02996 domain-containing protein n=1 Tax=Zavarzinella formosa TaxID=360055 RepID=UPI0002FB0CB5|nr:TIGR02996 domain-containing protein [Zavarzinella formosa]